MWVLLGIASAVFLGLYDGFKKFSLNNNAALPVLFFASLSGALIFIPIYAMSRISPEWASEQFWYVPVVSPRAHFMFLVKSMLVGSSWIMAYIGLRHLPLSTVAPIRATSPLWTLLGAILIYGESLRPLQWLGLSIALIFFWFFSFAGKHEGINFARNKWIFLIVGATLTGAASSLYDKYLVLNYDRMAMQTWFSFYMIPVLAPVLYFFWRPKRKTYPFKWNHAIPLIGLFLVLADFIYFYALSFEGSLISVISVLRRASVLVSFSFGAVFFREKNIRRKSLALTGICAGIFLLFYESY